MMGGIIVFKILVVEDDKNLRKLIVTTLKRNDYETYEATNGIEALDVIEKEYIDLVINFLEYLNPDIAIERFVSQSPKELLLAPDWGIKNFEFVAKIDKRMQQRNTFQGKLYDSTSKR